MKIQQELDEPSEHAAAADRAEASWVFSKHPKYRGGYNIDSYVSLAERRDFACLLLERAHELAMLIDLEVDADVCGIRDTSNNAPVFDGHCELLEAQKEMGIVVKIVERYRQAAQKLSQAAHEGM